MALVTRASKPAQLFAIATQDSATTLDLVSTSAQRLRHQNRKGRQSHRTNRNHPNVHAVVLGLT